MADQPNDQHSGQPKVEVYYKPMCGYSHRAMDLLKKKGVAFDELNAFADPDLRQAMLQRSGGGRTYPQIFIGGEHIGGSDQLAALERAGKLDTLLGR